MSVRHRSLIAVCWAFALCCIAVHAAPALGSAPPPMVPPAPVALPSGPLTVEDAVALALRQNPAVVLARQGVQYAVTQVNVARAAGRPTAALAVTNMYNFSVPSVNIGSSAIQTSSAFTSSGALTISQPVWPSTIWQAPIRSAQAGVDISRENYVRAQQQVAFQTRQAYFLVLGNQELLTVAQDAVTVAQTQLKLAESTVRAGLAAPLDVYQARATLANAQVAETQARNAVDVALAGLAIDIGLPAGTPLTMAAPPALPALPPDLPALTQTALRQRPDLTQITFRRQQLQATIAQFRLEQTPTVAVQASYAKPLLGENFLSANGLTVAAVVALNLYTGGKTSAEVAGARVQLAELDTTAQQLSLSITLDVRQAWLNLQNAQQQLVSAQQGRDAAAEALRIAEIRYQNGEGIVLEVEQARLSLTQALTALAQARFQALVAAAQLDFALGTPVGTASR